MKIYAFHNLLVGYFTPPQFESIPQEEKIEQCRRFCLTHTEEAFKLHMEECALVYLGEFDDVTGTFALAAQPEAIANLAAFLPKAMEAADGQDIA